MRFLKLPLICAAATIGFAAAPAMAASDTSAAAECNGDEDERDQQRSDKRKDMSTKPSRKPVSKKGQCRTCRILM